MQGIARCYWGYGEGFCYPIVLAACVEFRREGKNQAQRRSVGYQLPWETEELYWEEETLKTGTVFN